MKKITFVPKFSFLVTFAVCTSVLSLQTSCNKTTSSPAAATVTVDDAADAVTQSVTSQSGGMVLQTETSVFIASDNNISCGMENDTTLADQSSVGASTSFNVKLQWNSLLTCSNEIPQQYQFNFKGKYSYDAPAISSVDSSQAQFILSGLQPLATQYVLNETYTRSGSQISNVRNKNSFSSIIAINATGLAVNKSSGQIVSGTAGVSISGRDSKGNVFSFDGTIIFLGNGQATLVLGSGNSYPIQW